RVVDYPGRVSWTAWLRGQSLGRRPRRRAGVRTHDRAFPQSRSRIVSHSSCAGWWHRFTGRFEAGRQRRRGNGPGRSSGRPPLGLEALEERALPSTLTVFNNDDSGPGSLRAAIGAAAAGDTIIFDNGLKGQTITLTGGELDITKDLTIVGLGAGKLTVSGG